MNKKVLTVDDSKTLRMLIGKHLASFGVEMHQAENGEQGIQRARETHPDVILLDYNMPILDGYHTLIELKTDPALKPIPVVMLTTETVKETVVKLLKLGLKDYIAKPFTREVLLQKLNPILGLYEGTEVPPEKPMAANIPELSTGPAKPTILAIDDKVNILEQLKTNLSEVYSFIVADSGKSALSAISHSKFDYMYLDLSLPDMSGVEVLEAYLKSGRNNASVRKVIAMSLRTAQSDIDQALNAGISLFLYKPFSGDDVKTAMEQLMSQQMDGSKRKQSFLTAKGKVRILECPPEKSARFRAFAGSLGSEVVREIDDMAEEGLSQLVIKVGEGFLSDMGITRKFVNLVEHTNQLSLRVRLVADSDQARDALKQFAETADIPTDTSLECALSSME
jgi:two-component system, cell cycle response regulator